MCRFVPQVSIFVLYLDGCANYIASLYNSGVGALQPCGIPSRQDIWGDEDQDIYKRRRRGTEQGWTVEDGSPLVLIAEI